MLYIHKKDEDMTQIELEDPENNVATQEELHREELLVAATKLANRWTRENRILNSLNTHILTRYHDKTQQRIDAKIDHLVDFYRKRRVSPGKSPVLHAILSFIAVYGDQFPRDANVYKAWQYGKYLYEIYNIKHHSRIELKRDGIILLSFT